MSKETKPKLYWLNPVHHQVAKLALFARCFGFCLRPPKHFSISLPLPGLGMTCDFKRVENALELFFFREQIYLISRTYIRDASTRICVHRFSKVRTLRSVMTLSDFVKKKPTLTCSSINIISFSASAVGLSEKSCYGPSYHLVCELVVLQAHDGSTMVGTINIYSPCNCRV